MTFIGSGNPFLCLGLIVFIQRHISEQRHLEVLLIDVLWVLHIDWNPRQSVVPTDSKARACCTFSSQNTCALRLSFAVWCLPRFESYLWANPPLSASDALRSWGTGAVAYHTSLSGSCTYVQLTDASGPQSWTKEKICSTCSFICVLRHVFFCHSSSVLPMKLLIAVLLTLAEIARKCRCIQTWSWVEMRILSADPPGRLKSTWTWFQEVSKPNPLTTS